MTVIRGLPRIFRDTKPILGESIVWDADAAELLWCDITAGLLHRSPLDGPVDGSADATFELPPPLASFYPATGGGYVASLGDRIVRVGADGTVAETLAEIEHVHAGIRMNEGKVDPVGRWVTGSMNISTGEGDGAMYSIESEGRFRMLEGGLAVSNGFDWSLDGRTMYFADTGVQTIYRARYTDGGDVEDVEALTSGEMHDGLAVDTDGYLWSGIYGGGKVIRYTPDGDEDLTVELDVPNITSVAFGGPDMSTLFVASARENMTEEQLEQHPSSGAIFAVDTSVHGKPPRWFG